MGSHCSAIKVSNIVLPGKKVDSSGIAPVTEPGVSSSQEAHTGQSKTKESPISAPRKFPKQIQGEQHLVMGVTIKQKARNGTQSPHSSENKIGSSTQFTETNVSRTTEASIKPRLAYKKGPLMGKGTYGEVYECLNLNSGELLAVKSFKVYGDPSKATNYIETMKKEVSHLKTLDHQNIVKYFTADAAEPQEPNYATVDIVLEYVSGGSVRKLLDKFTKLEEKVISTYIRQVLEGLTYLHIHGIVHRNIKGSNILIDTTGVIKLTDFGCSGRTAFSEDNPPESARSKTLPYWSAPEVVMRKAQGKPADVWSVGCVVLEMLTGLPPWSNGPRNMEEFVRQISLGTPPPFPPEITENCRDFLYKTFKFKPEERLSPLQLLDHPFVREDMLDNSYMEAESIPTNRTQTYPSGSFNPGRAIDLLTVDSRLGEKKYMDLKTNNFMQKTSTGISISNINVGKMPTILTSEFYLSASPTNLLRSSDSSKETKFEITLNKTPSPEKESNASLSISNKFVNKNGLMDVSEVSHDDDDFSPPKMKKKQYPFDVATTTMGLQTLEQQQREENAAKEAKRKQLEEEMMRELQRINTNAFSEMDYRSRTFSGSLSQHSSKKKNTISSMSMSGKRTMGEEKIVIDPNNEAEIQKLKEKLRKQFEEQMEQSLARINSEKFTSTGEKDTQSERSESKNFEGFRRTFEEEIASHLVGTTAENVKDVWKEKSGSEVSIFGKKKDTIVGWERKEFYEVDASIKETSPQMTESDKGSPEEKKIKKNKDNETPFEKIQDIQTREMQITEEDEDNKLGIINEAEELKEDSFVNELSHKKHSLKQFV